MPKIKTLQSMLNAGECPPRLHGRPDSPRYQHGFELCRNFLPLVTGGAVRFPGRRHVARKAAGPVRQVEFLHSAAGILTGYLLEFYGGAIYFYRDDAAILDDGDPYTIVSPYTDDHLPGLHYDQDENTLYLFHPDVAPQRLTRQADTAWTIEPVPFVALPFLRPPGTDDITITPDGTSGDIELVASADLFEAGHVGMKFKVNGGIVEITAVTDATHADATVTADIVPDTAQKTRTDSILVECAQEVLPSGDPVNVYFAVNLTAVANFLEDTLTTTGIDLPAGVTLTVVPASANLTGTEADKEWRAEAWSDLYGWPRAVAFFQQRMLLGYTRTYPSTVFGSMSGKPLNFTTGTSDGDAFTFPIVGVNTGIEHLAASDQVYILTGNREVILHGLGDKQITPTAFQFEVRTFHGTAATCRPLRVGGSLFFATTSNQRLRTIEYDLATDRYNAPDFGVLGEHLLEEGGGILRGVYVPEPWGAFFFVTNAGHLLSFTYDAQQQVYAWARHHEDGTEIFRDISAIPDADGTLRVFFAVERDGCLCTEYLDATLNTAAAVTFSDAEGLDTWDVPAHLQGKTVDVVADGFVLPRQEAGATLNLEWPAKTVEIGLPYRSTLRDLPPGNIGGANVLTEQTSVNLVRVLLHQSKGCTLNGEQIPFRSFGEGFDTPVQAFTGWKGVGAMGWSDDGKASQVEIVQDLPLPCTVLAIVKEVTING